MQQGGNSDRDGSNGALNRKRSMRPVFLAGLVLFALIAALVAFKLAHHSKVAPPPMAVRASVEAPPPKIEPVSIAKAPVVVARPATNAAAATEPALMSPEMMTPQQLADELAKIGKGPITAEQAARFKADLKELIRRGPASVPALQALLQQNFDESFGDTTGGDQLGYSGLRASLIDALNQIGGAAAQTALVDTMNSTAVPAELLQIAQDLDKQAPGQYNDEIVSNAQATLSMASSGQLGTNAEIGPAYRALQNFGNANTTADAANTDPVDFYNAVQLANMPDGQGLTSLLQMEQNTTGTSQAIATDMIAQMAGQNGDALNALAQMAQNGQISQNEWVQIAPILAGAQYQMNSSGNDYTVVDNDLAPDKINQRIQMLNTFMNFVPEGTGGAKAIQQEINTLNGQSGN
ncbi:MAG TPA: hypothetical protein VH280_09015 [Verrucomicrobiae bacterium]|jgi:hypothetical protein|nr:hypothetical protein [Verrucomicrobiae bacterium]